MPGIPAGATCAQCGHPMDPHLFVRVDTGSDLPEGYVRCPEDCGCWSTWRTGTRRSTQTEIIATRLRVLAELACHGRLDHRGVPQEHPLS